MPKLPYILAAVVMGAIIAIQPGLNADVARRLGSPVGAAFLSITVSFVAALAYVVIAREPIGFSGLTALPWYLWVAGLIGFAFVVLGLWLAPVLGAALLFASVVAGQMLGATLADRFGIAGYQAHAIDIWRIVGIGLVIAGVVVLQRAG